jgi:hypothetical protein
MRMVGVFLWSKLNESLTDQGFEILLKGALRLSKRTFVPRNYGASSPIPRLQ